MADDVDNANELFEKEISLALRKNRQHLTEKKHRTEYCIECGETIPVARQNMGFDMCVECATENERRQLLFNHR